MGGLRLAFTITLLLGGLFSPSAAEAQQAAKVARIGYLVPNPAAANPHLREAFLQGLRDLGYVEGRNLVIDYRYAEGKFERLPFLRPNWLRSRLMSSWLGPRPPPWPPSTRPGPSPLCSLVVAIGLRTGSSPALRGRAAMSRGCPASARIWPASGWNCSSGPFRGQSGCRPLAAGCRGRAHGNEHVEGCRTRGAGAEDAAASG